MTTIIPRTLLRYLAVASLMTLAACQQPGTKRTATQPETPQQAAAAQQQTPNTAAPVVTFHLAQAQPAQGLAQVQVNPNASLYAVPRPVFTQADLQQVVTTQNNNGQTFLRFDFNPQGAAKLAQVARDATGSYLLISVRGKLIAVPQIAASYPEGKLPVPVQNADEARSILQLLRQPSS